MRLPAIKKKKDKRKKKTAPEIDAKTKAVIDEAIRIRTRMRIKDAEGRERIFRSTIAEKGDRDAE
jgi:hypothetical protein